MRKLVYYIGTSLDGRIAGPRGEVDFFPTGDEEQTRAYATWINARHPETVPTALRARVGLADAPNLRFDTVLMGHGTYRAALDHGTPSPYAHLRQYVVSRTLGTAPDPAVTVVDGDPLALVRGLKREEGRDIWLCGGGRLAGALLPGIDELIIKSYPVVAGSGTPVFDGEFDPARFAVTDRHTFPNDVTVTWFTARR
ncbi:dihydrofolate reductase family protein [Streptomyces sp. MST-110588]|uniref:dihydrofolate reductase family protein n=1 Tax=Streptomyces sp. MST-110588 TaxID=2833628 RepID=UPI001F5CE261|nr:dihydrofolate reductase family protein [Streptomyces sp. MST-110588]UNO38973.1 dihydrofolate reductase family protein [Streptomyces sp. MST-110588]